MSLIKEFAIEPRVMATWTHFNALWEDFGVGAGRLISVFPLTWKTKVDELAKTCSPPVRASAISSKIRNEEHKFLITGRTFQGNLDWLAAAVAHNGTQPFHAIIVSENPRKEKDVLVAGEFAKDEAPYKVVPEDFVCRSAPDLAACVSLLLRYCSEVQLIDPHFEPSEPRFRDTFEAMLGLCDKRSHRRIEIHREKPHTYVPGAVESKYKRNLESIVPTGIKLRVFFWTQKPGGLGLHPRFLLTDLGGMNFENGLDTGDAGTKTLVKPLSCEIWRQCRGFLQREQWNLRVHAGGCGGGERNWLRRSSRGGAMVSGDMRNGHWGQS